MRARIAGAEPRPAGLRAPGAVLLVSCYELGRQPQALASPLAFLERAGFRPAPLDLALEKLDPEKIRRARFAGISVPMHTALRLGVRVGRRIRELNPACHVCYYGHYAILHGESLLRASADSVLGGEFEEHLVELVEAVESGEAVAIRSRRHFARLDFPVPSRATLPGLERYAHLVRRGQHTIAGQVEASRGCLHHCRHCPIPPVYGGRLFVVPMETVLADIRNQVRSGARHITFTDADFLNGPAHSLRLARALHAEFPEVTFDFTAKVEHILNNRERVLELGRLGALFMVSAVESLSDGVLEILDKGHTRADVFAALEILRQAGISMRPSLLPFTPWSTRADFVDLLDFAESEDLVDHIDPVQYTIRLLVPPGSLLLAHPAMQPHLENFDAEALTARWFHPDPGMDALQQQLAALVESATAADEDPRDIFQSIRTLAGTPRSVPKRRHERPPRLTEPWFC